MAREERRNKSKLDRVTRQAVLSSNKEQLGHSGGRQEVASPHGDVTTRSNCPRTLRNTTLVNAHNLKPHILTRRENRTAAAGNLSAGTSASITELSRVYMMNYLQCRIKIGPPQNITQVIIWGRTFHWSLCSSSDIM